MPWQETHPMDQRLHFVADHQRGLYAMTTLCARYGVSRKTGYKWLQRYAAEGAAMSLDEAVAYAFETFQMPAEPEPTGLP